MSRSQNWRQVQSMALVLATFAAISGCKRSAERSGPPMQQAAQLLCQAAKLGLDPPDEAYRAFAKEMNTELKHVKPQAKDPVGTMAFARHVEVHAKRLPAAATKGLAEIWSGITAVDPTRKYELLRSGFAEQGVELKCPQLQRFFARSPVKPR